MATPLQKIKGPTLVPPPSTARKTEVERLMLDTAALGITSTIGRRASRSTIGKTDEQLAKIDNERAVRASARKPRRGRRAGSTVTDEDDTRSISSRSSISSFNSDLGSTLEAEEIEAHHPNDDTPVQRRKKKTSADSNESVGDLGTIVPFSDRLYA